MKTRGKWIKEICTIFALVNANGVSHGDPSDVELKQTEDEDVFESIKALHQQLDDDNDGTIEPFETVDFIRSDLEAQGSLQGTNERQKVFHNKDKEITVKDLWKIWKQSEVHNWNMEETIYWLETTVKLPQYTERFRTKKVAGSKMPLIAMDSNFLTKTLEISNPIHRSKISLKAMDAVLFGPPNQFSNRSKEIFLTVALILAISGMLYAIRLHQRSQNDIQKMMLDMKDLTKAEESLKVLQGGRSTEKGSSMEVSKLKQEVAVLKSELNRAEEELEDRSWIAPPLLQTWLQLIYETEVQQYNIKKKAAGLELEDIRFMCEKIKQKRLSLIGAFISTHAGSIDEAERMIANSKDKFDKLAKEYTEMTRKWKVVESLCGCEIMQNPGIEMLQSLTSATPMPRFSLHSTHTIPLGSMENGLTFDENIDALSSSTASSKSYEGQKPRRKKESLVGMVAENITVTVPSKKSEKSKTNKDLSKYCTFSVVIENSHEENVEQIHSLTAEARLKADFHVDQDDENFHKDASFEINVETKIGGSFQYKESSSNSKSSSTTSLPSLNLNMSKSTMSLGIPDVSKRSYSQADISLQSTTGDSNSMASEPGGEAKKPPKKPKRKGLFSFGRKKSAK